MGGMNPTFWRAMRLRRQLILLFTLVAWLTMACEPPERYLLPEAAHQNARANQPVSVTAEGEGNHATASVENDVLTVKINSERGIGGALVTVADDDLPEQIVLHLHLSGLERLQISTATATVVAEVSSLSSAESLQYVLTNPADATLEPIASDNPLWLTVLPVSHNGTYFKVSLPPRLYANTHHPIQIEWIDFYR